MYLTASQMNHVTTLKCTKKKVGDLSNFRKQYLTAHYKKNSKIKGKWLQRNKFSFLENSCAQDAPGMERGSPVSSQTPLYLNSTS